MAHQPDEQPHHPAADGQAYQARDVSDQARCELSPLLEILRSLTTEELEQPRPTAVIHESCTQDECHGGNELDPLGRVLDIDEFDFSEPEPTKNMEMDNTLCLSASDADLSISSLVGENLSGFSQPVPSDHIPLTGETLPGFSQSASSDLTTTQYAPILQPVVIPHPQ